MKHIPYALTIGALITSTTAVVAQDYKRFAPKEVPQSNQRVTQLNSGGTKIQVSNNDQVLLPKLRGLKVVLKESQVSSKALRLNGVDTPQDEIMRDPGMQQILNNAIGKPVSLRSLSQLQKEIVLHYRKLNTPLVDVILPEQDITHGVVQLLVVEGKTGNVSVIGNRYFSTNYVRSNVNLQSGDRIKSDSLLDDVNWLNANAFLQVRPVLVAGAKKYTTDVVLHVDDKRPWRGYVGYENSGNELTGTNRYLLGFNWGNAFGLGHSFNYQMTTADDFNELNAHSFSYQIPLHWRHHLHLFGSYVDTSVDTGTFSIEGESYEAGARYIIPLESSESFNHSFYMGFGWKSSENALEFGVVPPAGTKTVVGQFNVGYKGAIRHDAGLGSLTSYDIGLTYSPGGMFGHNDSASFDSSRTGARASYAYLSASVNHLHKLPKKFVWSTELTGQWSDGNLLNSEQIGVGGYSTVRGYDEREFNGSDSGVVIRNEIRSPEVSLLSKADKWQFLVFSDFAYAAAHSGPMTRADGSQAESDTLWSAGVGTRMRFSDRFTLRADYGVQLTDVNSDAGNGKFHIGGIVTF